MILSPLRSNLPVIAGWLSIFVLVFGWSLWRLGAASAACAGAEQALAERVRDVQRLDNARTVVQGLSAGRRPDADIVARVQRALINAGLPAETVSEVQPRVDQTSTTGMRAQVVQMKLQALDPAGFGAWLSAWDKGDQPWQVTEVQMIHAVPTTMDTGRARPTMDSNRFDITVVLSAPYWEESP